MASNTYQWWQRGIVYQIYPRSFMDSNADGTGDLPGILSRIDYLAWLGIEAIWISPIFPSPMADYGYDVSDYTGVHPLFGSLADLDRLVEAAHARSIRVLLDYVPNHSSDQHPWFIDSRSSRQAARRDWYIWRDGRPDGSPPNNWISVFGGRAWQLDPTTGQFYYHAYLKEQPDLNWRNPAVRSAMLDVLRFWLDRGIDGFRIDALRQVIKDDQLRDNPPNTSWTGDPEHYRAQMQVYNTDQPEVLDIVREFRALTDTYSERLLIGELYLPIERLVMYYGENGDGLHLPFNFHLILTAWNAPAIGALVEAYEAALPPGAWPNWVLGNHDQPRVASRIGAPQARVAALLLLTLRGTPTVYQGEEIGMHDVAVPESARQDPVGRDPERTPMQWDASEHAGFTHGTPWLPLAPDAATLNVESQRSDPHSMLSLYRALIDLRRESDALAVGSYRQVHVDGNLLVYDREHEGQRLRIALNLSNAAQPLPVTLTDGTRVVLSTHLDQPSDPTTLRANEGRVLGPA